jgi:hypothetical protein
MRISPVHDGNRILVPQTVDVIFTDLPRIILNADIYCTAGYGVGALEPFGSRGRILLEACSSVLSRHRNTLLCASIPHVHHSPPFSAQVTNECVPASTGTPFTFYCISVATAWKLELIGFCVVTYITRCGT